MTIEISREHLQRRLPGFDSERSLDDIRESIRRSQAQLEGRLRSSAIGPNGQPCDLLLYALTPEDYANARASWRSS